MWAAQVETRLHTSDSTADDKRWERSLEYFETMLSTTALHPASTASCVD
jgi:hypothetical protein